MKLYNVNSVLDGVNGFGLEFADSDDSVFTVKLAANTAASLTVPSTFPKGTVQDTINKYCAVMSYHAGRNVYVSSSGTATIPAAAAFALSNSELNPPAKFVKAGDVLSFICATADTEVCVAFYGVL